MPDHEILPAQPDSSTGHVGTYRRRLPVNLERMFENTLDWEHLPYVHASSFKSIHCLDAGPWGWRAQLIDAADNESVIELRLDRTLRRWITRNLEGRSRGAEIWTHVFPVDADQLDIIVDFFVPGVAAADRNKVGQAYASLYQRLYDEDVMMMVQRQQHLDERMDTTVSELDLGPRSGLRTPTTVALGSRKVIVAEVAGDLVAYPALCPHQLGPLQDAPLEGALVRCPWHGYQFDVRSGKCVSGASCRLRVLDVSEKDGRVMVSEPGG